MQSANYFTKHELETYFNTSLSMLKQSSFSTSIFSKTPTQVSESYIKFYTFLKRSQSMENMFLATQVPHEILQTYKYPK